LTLLTTSENQGHYHNADRWKNDSLFPEII
jgi:hypothetical protein